jgi:Mor family transcriptional regulator
MKKAQSYSIEEISNYFNETADATIQSTAEHFRMRYGITRKRLLAGVGGGLIDSDLYDKRKQDRIHKDSNYIERRKTAANLRKDGGLRLEEIGEEMGVKGERARQFLTDAIKLGFITKEEYKNATKKEEREAYDRSCYSFVSNVATLILDLDRDVYQILLSEHDLSPREGYDAIRTVLGDSLEQGLFEPVEGDGLEGFIRKFSKSLVSFSVLQDMATEYKETEIRLKDLAIKYGLSKKSDINPASQAQAYMHLAIKLGFITQEEYTEKGKETVREIYRKLGREGNGRKGTRGKRKYSDAFARELFLQNQNGTPYPKLERKYGLPRNTSTRLVKRAKTEGVI